MLDEADIAVIVDTVKAVVDRVMAERMETVYGTLEEIREQTYNSITVLSGNDDALLGEIRKMQGATPAEVLTAAGESWSRFIRGEMAVLGIKEVRHRVKKEQADETETAAPVVKKKGG